MPCMYAVLTFNGEREKQKLHNGCGNKTNESDIHTYISLFVVDFCGHNEIIQQGNMGMCVEPDAILQRAAPPAWPMESDPQRDAARVVARCDVEPGRPNDHWWPFADNDIGPGTRGHPHSCGRVASWHNRLQCGVLVLYRSRNCGLPIDIERNVCCSNTLSNPVHAKPKLHPGIQFFACYDRHQRSTPRARDSQYRFCCGDCFAVFHCCCHTHSTSLVDSAQTWTLNTRTTDHNDTENAFAKQHKDCFCSWIKSTKHLSQLKRNQQRTRTRPQKTKKLCIYTCNSWWRPRHWTSEHFFTWQKKDQETFSFFCCLLTQIMAHSFENDSDDGIYVCVCVHMWWFKRMVWYVVVQISLTIETVPNWNVVLMLCFFFACWFDVFFLVCLVGTFAQLMRKRRLETTTYVKKQSKKDDDDDEDDAREFQVDVCVCVCVCVMYVSYVLMYTHITCMAGSVATIHRPGKTPVRRGRKIQKTTTNGKGNSSQTTIAVQHGDSNSCRDRGRRTCDQPKYKTPDTGTKGQQQWAASAASFVVLPAVRSGHRFGQWTGIDSANNYRCRFGNRCGWQREHRASALRMLPPYHSQRQVRSLGCALPVQWNMWKSMVQHAYFLFCDVFFFCFFFQFSGGRYCPSSKKPFSFKKSKFGSSSSSSSITLYPCGCVSGQW